MSLHPPRVVPTLTEVLDETVFRNSGPAALPEAPVAAAAVQAVPVEPVAVPGEPAFGAFEAPGPLPLPADDFELDLNLGQAPEPPMPPPWAPSKAPEPAASAAQPDQAFFEALEAALRQRAGLAFDLALDEWLEQELRERIEQAAARHAQGLLQELRDLLAPQMEALLQKTLNEVLQQERDRLLR